LPNRRTVDGIAVWCDVLNLEAHHVAATQLAIDREIEQRQVPSAPCEAWSLFAEPFAQCSATPAI
jgi:hypothetical protein